MGSAGGARRRSSGRCAGFEGAGFVATMTRGRGLMHGEVLPAEVEEEFEAAVGEAGERFRSPNRTRSAFTLATGWLTANTHDCALCSHDCGRADRPDLHYHEQASHLIMAGRKRPD